MKLRIKSQTLSINSSSPSTTPIRLPGHVADDVQQHKTQDHDDLNDLEPFWLAANTEPNHPDPPPPIPKRRNGPTHGCSFVVSHRTPIYKLINLDSVTHWHVAMWLDMTGRVCSVADRWFESVLLATT
jgi:hypothetical protein